MPKCPWARHWIPVSCESAAPDLTLCSDLRGLKLRKQQQQQQQKKPRMHLSAFFSHHIDHPKEEFHVCLLLSIRRSVCGVSFGTVPLDNGWGFIGLFKDTLSPFRKKRKQTCVPWKHSFYFISRFCSLTTQRFFRQSSEQRSNGSVWSYFFQSGKNRTVALFGQLSSHPIWEHGNNFLDFILLKQ